MIHLRMQFLLLITYLNVFSNLNIFSFGCPQHEVEGRTDTFNSVSNDMKMICYYGSWSVYRPGNGKFPVEEIDPFLCSHLVYAFAGLGHDNKIRPLDPYNDLKENYGKGAFVRFNSLKTVNKNLKTLIAIGGWNEGSIKYSNMASKPETRKIFVDSVVDFIAKYDFDGLDLDWEYPAARGGKPEDKQNFVALLRELKQAFTPRGYLLTAAVSAGKWFVDPAYDVPQVSEYLDIINIMCYDYHGGWDNKTGHNAPLYGRPDEVDNDRISNVNFSINYWISRGAPKNKIVLGMGTYGRSFTLQRAENNGLGAPAPQSGQAGPYTREAGSLGYNEICEMRLNNNQWTEVRDPYHLAPYAYRDRQWVGYDDVESITLKAQYIKAMQLAGGMIWSIETDDFRGKCGQKYPLLNAINKVFKSDSVVLPLPTPSGTDVVKPSTPSSVPTTKPWTWVKPTKASPSTSTSTTQTPSSEPSSSPSTASSIIWWSSVSTSPSPSSTWWPRPSSSSSSSPSSPSSIIWWSSTAKPSTPSSSSSNSWPWAETHPTPSSSANTKPEQITSTTTKSTTSKSTTSVSSVETPGSGEENTKFVCKQVGIFKHPKDCQKFYRCVQTVRDGRYTLHTYSCPDRTVFNGETSLCDWVENVPECINKVPKHFFRNVNFFRN